ncbi:MAG: HAD family hydrolase [Polyangiales bacterium]
MAIREMTVDEVCDEMRSPPAGFLRVVATDADGTLWDGDVGDALFRHLIARDAVDARAREATRELCARYLPRVPEGLSAQAEALIAGHAAGLVPIEPLCDLEAEAAGGRSIAELDAFLAEVGGSFAARMRPESVELLTRLRGDGFAVHVVTGSLGALVEATLRAAGLVVDAVSGGSLRVHDGQVLPTLAQPIPLHGGKVEALRAAGRWPAAVAMGDGGWDASFLSGSALPLLVHPRPTLLEAMKEHPSVARLSPVPL